MHLRTRCRIAFAILGLSLLLAGVATAATISGTVNLTDTANDAGVQVALTVFEAEQELFATPTVGQWGLIFTGLLLASIGTWLLIRRRSLGGWGTGVGILLMFLAVVPNLVGTARSVDPVVVTSGAGGTFTFTSVAVGNYGVSAYKDLYKLTESSLQGGVVLITSAGQSVTGITLTMNPDASCPVAKGLEAPEAVPPQYWASIKASPHWNQLSEIGKAGTQVLEGSATLVRGTGAEFTSVIVPISEPSIAANQSRNFVSHFDASGGYLGSYVIDIASPVGTFDEELGVVPDLIRLSTPDGKLIAEARFSNGRLISQIEGTGLPRTATCASFARCLATKWTTIPGWIRRICKGACVSCFTTPQPLSCTVCVGCVVVYVGNCWCTNTPCPP